jgi:hypothetical protein
MNTAREYWQHAAACLRLAHESSEFYVKVALTELAGEYCRKADTIETCGNDQRDRKSGDDVEDR